MAGAKIIGSTRIIVLSLGAALGAALLGGCSSSSPVVYGSAVDRDVYGEPIMMTLPSQAAQVSEESVSGGLWGE